ncbi:NUDIX hydrolase [Streptomyces sp. NPDC001985]|uniref:NUDIX hydrolase n=1 Tax=Streptomyces sp. NPDC001985 TaxID=3154406 RepID=UPI003328045C
MSDDGVEFLVRGTREAYRSPYLVVREEDVTFPDGSPGLYSIVEKEDFSLVIPVLPSGSLCLVSVYRHPVRQRFWEFPQGSCAKPGEPAPSPLETARTELREETGYRAARWERLGELHEAYGYATGSCHVYTASGLRRGTASPEPSEGLLHTQEFTREAVWRMVGRGEVRDAVTVAALGLYEHRRKG